MNPEQPSREQIEARLTALLLGELPAAEAELLRWTISQDPELQKLHDQLKLTIGFVREAMKNPTGAPLEHETPLKMPQNRRQNLMAHFKTARPQKTESFWLRQLKFSPLVPLLGAIAIVALLASLLLPVLSTAKIKSKHATLGVEMAKIKREPGQGPVSPNSTGEGQSARRNPDEPKPAAPQVQIALPNTESSQKDSGQGEVYSQNVVGYVTNVNPGSYTEFANQLEPAPKTEPTFTFSSSQSAASTAAPFANRLQSTLSGAEPAPIPEMASAPQPKIFICPPDSSANQATNYSQLAEQAPPTVAGRNYTVSAAPSAPPVSSPLASSAERAPTGFSGSLGDKNGVNEEWFLGNERVANGPFDNGIQNRVQRNALAYSDNGTPYAQGVKYRDLSQLGNVTNAVAMNQPQSTFYGSINNLGVHDGDRNLGTRENQNANVVVQTGLPEVAGGGGADMARVGLPPRAKQHYRAMQKNPGSGEVAPVSQATESNASANQAGELWAAAQANAAAPQSEIRARESRNPKKEIDNYDRLVPLRAPISAASRVTTNWALPQQQYAQNGLQGNDLSMQSAAKQTDRATQQEVPALQDQKLDAATLARDGQMLYEMGKLEDAGLKLQQSLQLDPGNPGANYYLKLVKEAQPGRTDQDNATHIAQVERVWEKPINAKGQQVGTPASPQQADRPLTRPKPSAPIPQPEIQTVDNAFSTFAMNVSDVSFKLAMASLQKGQMPDPASIRSEEFINAFDYHDPEPLQGEPLAFVAERAADPFAQERDMLRFSIKAAAAGRQDGRALNLVLLLDTSGSMERADRVAIIREMLHVLSAQLQPHDVVSVVTFARTARLWADGIPGDQAGGTLDKVGSITPEGGTNLEEAMRLAYETALRHFIAGGMNRVVMLTDGAANLGDVDPKTLTQRVDSERRQGIALDCFGIGWDDYNDDLLEQLSSNGDGRYAFINSPDEAATEFATKLAGALQVAAEDVKVQVEFNPSRVTAWRQIGYAKHQLTKEQFRDNTVAAGAIAAREAGNALYAIETNPNGEGPIATVRVRYRVPGTQDVHEKSWLVDYTGAAPELAQSSPAMRLAVTASEISEWMADSPFAQDVTPDELLNYLSGVPQFYGTDERPKQLETMIREAKSVSGK